MFKRSFIGVVALAALATPALAAGDADKGEKVFKKCQACHQVGDDAQNRVGPVLNDIIGRQAGTVEGFGYSDAMTEAGEEGMVWNDEHLHEYLADPKGYIPKNKMSFAGLKKKEDRDDVIAYLEQFSDPAAVEADHSGDEPDGADDSSDSEE